jgi:WD repeat-containing protein 81
MLFSILILSFCTFF